MPFFGGSRSSSTSRKHTSESSRESYLSPPPMFLEDDVFTDPNRYPPSYEPPPYAEHNTQPKKELNVGAKRLLKNKSNKESGLRKLMRRHSSKIPSELRDPSPEDPPRYTSALKNGNHSTSIGSYTDDMIAGLDSRHRSMPKGVTFAEQEAKLDYYNHSDKLKKHSKSLKKSKSISHKMPLQSALKSSSVSSSATKSDEDRLSHSSGDNPSHHHHNHHNQHHHIYRGDEPLGFHERHRQFFAGYQGKLR